MAATPTTDIPLGFQAPSFALTDAVTGTTVTSDDVFAGGPTVVVFMCNHCPFVVHILEAFVAFASECRGKGVNVVAISSNDVVNYPQDDVPLMKELAEGTPSRSPTSTTPPKTSPARTMRRAPPTSACLTRTKRACIGVSLTAPDRATTSP